MDWKQANVSLDQEAFTNAQAAGNSNFHIPTSWIIIIVLIIAGVAFAVVKKSKDGGSKGDSSSGGGDKK